MQSSGFRWTFPKGTGRKGGVYSRSDTGQNRIEGKQGKDRATCQDCEWHEPSKFLLHSCHSLAALSFSSFILCYGLFIFEGQTVWILTCEMDILIALLV